MKITPVKPQEHTYLLELSQRELDGIVLGIEVGKMSVSGTLYTTLVKYTSNNPYGN